MDFGQQSPGMWSIFGKKIPDFGLSELFNIAPNPVRTSQPIGPNSGLTGTLNNPTYDSSLNQSYQTPAIPGVTSGPNSSQQSLTSDAPTAPTAPTAPEAPTGPSAEELALMKWMSDLEGAKQQAGSLRTQGENTFQTLMDAAGNYRTRAGDLFTNAGQEITNAFSGLAGSNARLGQSARTSALNAARSAGYGDSSRLGLLNKVTGNLAGMQGEALARRGENQAANRTNRDTAFNEATRQETDAARRKTEIESRAGDIERLGIQNAGLDFGGLLNQLQSSYQALSQLNPLNQESLSSITPDFSGLTNSLNNLVADTGIGGSPTGGASNLSLSPINYQDLIKRYYS